MTTLRRYLVKKCERSNTFATIFTGVGIGLMILIASGLLTPWVVGIICLAGLFVLGGSK